MRFSNFIQNVSQSLSKCLSKHKSEDKLYYQKNPLRDFKNYFCSVQWFRQTVALPKPKNSKHSLFLSVCYFSTCNHSSSMSESSTGRHCKLGLDYTLGCAHFWCPNFIYVGLYTYGWQWGAFHNYFKRFTFPTLTSLEFI